MPKVSILIPIYNVEKYLRQCLDSVVNQTLKDIEIICINDGSTDNSLEIIKEFATKDSRIKIINKKNTGYGHSMNCGLEISQGEYIGIIESDDFADLNMFEVLYNHAKNSNAEIVRSNHFEQIDEHSKFIEVLREDLYNQIFTPRLQDYYFFSRQVAVWSGIYKRDFLSKNEINFTETPGASYQDISFAFKAFSCVDRLLLIKDAFVHYRVDNPNSSVKSKQKVYCIFDEFDEIEKFLLKRKEFYNPCRYIFESMIKFQRCEYHFSRIDDQFKFDFLQRMSKEFQKDNAAGYLNKNFWQEDKWSDVQTLLLDEKEYFYMLCRKIKLSRMYKNDFISKIKSFENIYIYGAGKVANYMLFELFRRHFSVKEIIVSQLENNPSFLEGIPVNVLEKSNFDREKDVILLALKEKDQPEILYKLSNEGCRNIIIVTKELRRELLYYYI
ncbi:MAG: glycosyltransferase [Selenomonadaceae bacterium]|nr:glycosyltransferase [Selenomonadaceae bacterium]